MRKNNETMSNKVDATNGSPLADELVQRINKRAYELFEQRGNESGHDVKDWLKAERLVLGQVHCRKEEE